MIHCCGFVTTSTRTMKWNMNHKMFMSININKRNVVTIPIPPNLNLKPTRSLLIFNLALNQLYDYDIIYKYQKALHSYIYKNRMGLLTNNDKIYDKNNIPIYFDAIIICEHESIYTLGRGSDITNILNFDNNSKSSNSNEKGIETDLETEPMNIMKLYEDHRNNKHFRTSNNSKIRRVERGGEVTWHGPGQLTLYPIIDLKKPTICHPNTTTTNNNNNTNNANENSNTTNITSNTTTTTSMKYEDIRWYVHALEECMIRILHKLDISSDRNTVNPGVWIQQPIPSIQSIPSIQQEGEECEKEKNDENCCYSYAKIAAIGISASRWVTLHGCSINVELDTQQLQYYYKHIVPCGIHDPLYRNITSVLQHLGTGSSSSSNSSSSGSSTKPYQTQVVDLFIDEFIHMFGYSGLNTDTDTYTGRCTHIIESYVLQDRQICNDISYRSKCNKVKVNINENINEKQYVYGNAIDILDHITSIIEEKE